MYKILLLSFVITLFTVDVHVKVNVSVAEKHSITKINFNSVIENKLYDNWDEGMNVAMREKKPILINFFSDYCGACKAMDLNTFADLEIKKRLTDYWVSIRIDTHNHDKKGTYDGKIMKYNELSKYFRVIVVPTFIFIDKKGEPVRSVIRL